MKPMSTVIRAVPLSKRKNDHPASLPMAVVSDFDIVKTPLTRLN
jgi:hypothetical protein